MKQKPIWHTTLRYSLIYGLFLVCAFLILLLHLGLTRENHFTPEILQLRLPKTEIALLAGYALGVSGLIIQGLTQNPLASPSILGMTSGAALVVATGMAFQNQLLSFVGLPYVAAFIGALISGGVVLMISGWQTSRRDPQRLILSGAVVTAICASLTQMIILINEEMSDHMLYWMVGGLEHAKKAQVFPLCMLLIFFTFICLFFSRRLDLITADQSMAQSLGVPLARTQITLILISVIMVSAAVAVVGPISFVGFVAPHMARLMGFRTHKHLIIMSGLLGGLLLLSADYGSSMITYPYESPAGLLTGSMGSLAFLIGILVRGRKDGRL